eukprot:3328809-Prymnesium_polylepis.1
MELQATCTNTSPVSPEAWSGRIEEAHPSSHLVGKVKRAKKSRSGSQTGPTKRRSCEGAQPRERRGMGSHNLNGLFSRRRARTTR